MNKPFRIIVAGGRFFNDYELLCHKLDKILKNITDEIIIVSGKAPGADSLGEKYAKERGYKIDEYPALWDVIEGIDPKYIKKNKWGKYYNVNAGRERNTVMSQNANALCAFWDQKSTGTAHMIDEATKRKLLIRVINY